MHIQKLQINNLRSFEKATLEFNSLTDKNLQYPNVNVLLGDNGVGKTSVLRAVALAVLAPLLSSSSGFVPDGLVRRRPEPRPDPKKPFVLNLDKPQPAMLIADVVSTEEEKPRKNSEWSMPDQYSITTEIRSVSSAERMRWSISPDELVEPIEHLQFDEGSPAFFIVGYGATRRVEASTRVDESARAKARLSRYERVASLFEDHLTLMPLSYWLPAFAEENKGRYTQVIHLINDLLPASCQIVEGQQTLYGREHLFDMNGVILPFRALSDGFKAYIGWIGDMLYHVCQGVGSGRKLRETRGIVMVDEIDLHLHPEWQLTVVPTLAKALPNVQFIFTTHSPLVVGSLMSQNLFVLEESEGATVIKRLPEHVRGKSAEQILLSPYFGLESTRAESTSMKLTELARSAVSGDTEASIEYLKIMAEGMSAEPTQKTRRKRQVVERPALEPEKLKTLKGYEP